MKWATGTQLQDCELWDANNIFPPEKEVTYLVVQGINDSDLKENRSTFTKSKAFSVFLKSSKKVPKFVCQSMQWYDKGKMIGWGPINDIQSYGLTMSISFSPIILSSDTVEGVAFKWWGHIGWESEGGLRDRSNYVQSVLSSSCPPPFF